MRPSGFTLIELAICLFILVLLLGSILVPISARVEARQIREVEAMLAETRDALLGYAIANGHLPCPDTDNDGAENVGGGTCTSTSGRLPHATLGVAFQSDPWGNRLTYRVEATFARRSPTAIVISSQANVRVCNTVPCTTNAQVLTDYDFTAVPLVPGNEAVAVILSHGKNGYGARNQLTGNTNAAPTSSHEIANTGAGPFVSRTHSAVGAAAGEFDDIVMWLSKPTLYGRMIAAGKLP